MMARLSPVPGAKLVKIFCNRFGFSPLRREGSHVIMAGNGVEITVPIHEIGVGLLSKILKAAGISREDYQREL